MVSLEQKQGTTLAPVALYFRRVQKSYVMFVLQEAQGGDSKSVPVVVFRLPMSKCAESPKSHLVRTTNHRGYLNNFHVSTFRRHK